jgi:hypothetical protein
MGMRLWLEAEKVNVHCAARRYDCGFFLADCRLAAAKSMGFVDTQKENPATIRS